MNIEKIISRLDSLQATSKALAAEAEVLKSLIAGEIKKPTNRVRARVIEKYNKRKAI